jgi:hypothetical protein
VPHLILTVIIVKRTGKNFFRNTDDTIANYNNALDELMQEFRDRTGRDVAIFVHSAGKDSDVSLILDVLIPLKVKRSISTAWFMHSVQDLIPQSNVYRALARALSLKSLSGSTAVKILFGV